MYYDRITRHVHIEFGGKEHLLALTLSGLEELEARAGESIVTLVTNGKLPKLSLLIDGFWLALRGGGERMQRAEAEALARDYIDEQENGVGDMANLFVVLVATSGLLGAKFTHETLDRLGITDKDGKPVGEAKNGKKAAGKDG